MRISQGVPDTTIEQEDVLWFDKAKGQTVVMIKPAGEQLHLALLVIFENTKQVGLCNWATYNLLPCNLKDMVEGTFKANIDIMDHSHYQVSTAKN